MFSKLVRPRSWTTFLLSAAVFVYLLLLLLPDSGRIAGLIGNPAPDLQMELPGLGPVKLSEFRGQVVLLNFWAEWCAPCLEEMPSLKVLEQKLDPKSFVLIAVNVEGEKARNTVDALGSQLPKNTVLSIQDSELKPYGVHALPYSVLVDVDGRVRKVFVGSRDWARPSQIEEFRKLLPKNRGVRD